MNNTSMLLDVQGYQTGGSGTIVQLFTSDGGEGGDDQKWWFVFNSDGSFRFAPSHDFGQSLDANVSTSNVAIWSNSGASNQKWVLEPVPEVYSKSYHQSAGYQWTYPTELGLFSLAGTVIESNLAIEGKYIGNQLNITSVWGYAGGFNEQWWSHNAFGISGSIQSRSITISGISQQVIWQPVFTNDEIYTSRSTTISKFYSSIPPIEFNYTVAAQGGDIMNPLRYPSISNY